MTRLFRGLRKQPPRPSYDAVIIGSGVGGLVCANLLARAGLSTLLVEQDYRAGGYCSIFRRGGSSPARPDAPTLWSSPGNSGQRLERVATPGRRSGLPRRS